MSEEKDVTITEIAAQKALKIFEENKKASEKLDMDKVGIRLFVQGGGCSGFQYGVMVEDNPAPGDKTFDSNGVKIYVDQISIRYLRGATIEWGDNMIGGGFKILNPHATATCGCGLSFTIDPDK